MSNGEAKRAVVVTVLTGAGPAMVECRECLGDGALELDRSDNPVELGCAACGGSGRSGGRYGHAFRVTPGSGEIAALCDACGSMCERGQSLRLFYPGTRDEYVCSSYCALWRLVGNEADEVIEHVSENAASLLPGVVDAVLDRAMQSELRRAS